MSAGSRCRRMPLVLLLCVAGCRSQPPTPTLVVLNDEDVVGLDPHAVGASFQTQTVLANAYEGLVAFDAEMSLRPALAVSWTNPDDHSWDFALRAGVRFHDGAALTPEDVVFSFERALGGERSLARMALGGVDQVKVLPGGGVRVHTRAPDASLLNRLRDVAIVSRRFVSGRGAKALAHESAGTGPYTLVAHRPAEAVELRRFDGHWQGAPELAQVRFLARSYGDADWRRLTPEPWRVLFWAPHDPAQAQAARHEAEARTAPGLGVSYLGFDLRGARAPGVAARRANPFLDLRVREALALALDHERLRLRVVDGEAAVPTQLVPPFVAGFDPTLAPPRRDLAAARRLLAEAGFEAGFDVDLDVREQMAAYAAPLAEDLGAVGIRVRPRLWPESDFFARVRAGASKLYVLRFSCRTGDAQELFDRWVHSRDAERGYGEANYSYSVDPVAGLDAEIESLRPTMDAAIRLARLRSLLRRVAEARLAVPLLHEKTVVYASPDLQWTPRADAFFLAAEVRLGPP